MGSMEPKRQQPSIKKKLRTENMDRFAREHDAPPVASTGTPEVHVIPWCCEGRATGDHLGEHSKECRYMYPPAPVPSEPGESAEQAFKRIMGLGSMPPDGSSEYDEWLFKKSYEAGAATLRAQLEYAEHWKNDWYTKLHERDTRIQRLRKEIMRASNTFFYVMNLSHRAWEDKKNLQAICERINAYGKMEHDLLEAALKEDSK